MFNDNFYFKLFLTSVFALSQGFLLLGIPESHVVRLPALINHRRGGHSHGSLNGVKILMSFRSWAQR